MGSSGSQPVKLNAEEKDQLSVSGYRLDRLKCFVTVCLAVFTFGFLFVILLWRKDVKMKLFYRQCPLRAATKVRVKVMISSTIHHRLQRRQSNAIWSILKDSYLQVYVEDVISTPFIRYFINKKVKYVWDDSTKRFVRLG